MRILIFAGTDAAMRQHALRQAIPSGVHSVDYSEHDMATDSGRRAGAAAVARGPLVGERRVVVWRNADALSTLKVVDPVWTLLLRVAGDPRPGVTLLAEGESVSIPVDGWSQLIGRATEQIFSTPSAFRPQDQRALVERIAEQVGVDLVDGAADAVVESCGTDSARIRHLLERLELAGAEVTAAAVRAAAPAEALGVVDLVTAALAGDKPRALRAAAAVVNGKPDLGKLLWAAQKHAFEQMVLVETLQADKGQVARILGYRKPGVVYYRRQELPMVSQAEAVLAEAIAAANEVTDGMRPTQQQVVQRLLISAFGSA